MGSYRLRLPQRECAHPDIKKGSSLLSSARKRHAIIDIVRAARNMPAADAGSDYQVWGWSEGGQTALWVNNIAGSYAPELTLKGVVATAPQPRS